MKNNVFHHIKLAALWILLLITPCFINAQENISIVPELNDDEIEHVNHRTDLIGSEWWNVWTNYRLAVKELSTSERWSAWVLTRDDIPIFLTLIVWFLSQLWMAVGVIFIMYAWYKYMLSVFNWWKAPTSSIKNAIIWVIIVIFSYTILRTLMSLVWLV